MTKLNESNEWINKHSSSMTSMMWSMMFWMSWCEIFDFGEILGSLQVTLSTKPTGNYFWPMTISYRWPIDDGSRCSMWCWFWNTVENEFQIEIARCIVANSNFAIINVITLLVDLHLFLVVYQSQCGAVESKSYSILTNTHTVK